MQKIIPHLWFDTQAKDATALYASLFPNSHIDHVQVITGTPSGDCDIVSFTLAGQEFKAISAGPYFKINPAISFFVYFNDMAEMDRVWNKLIEGGKALMPYQAYPWAQKYGWLQDKYGLSWQLSSCEDTEIKQKIVPLLMFTQQGAGKAKEAIETYTKLFPNSHIETMVPYAAGDGDDVKFLKHARFTLAGQNFMAMDSSGPHEFVFNEAISFIVNCENQAEIDAYWSALSAVPESEQCGWLKDKFGVSWQIVPTIMDEMMRSKDTEKINRVTKAFLQMKKFDIATLNEAYQGK